MSRGSSAGYDRHITIFSPEGRLYQVEYAFKAVRGSNLTAIGVRGADCVVLVSQKKVQDKLIDPKSVTNLYAVSPLIGCACTGLSADAKDLVARTRSFAAEFKYQNGYNIPVHVLAGKVADRAQVYTQHAAMRALGLVTMFAAVDDEKGPQLYRCDPAGHYVGYKACSAGQKEQEASNYLEKQIKANAAMTTDQALETAIIALQTVVGADLKPTDLEVGLVTREKPEWTTLTLDEIDARLTAISDRD